MAELFEHIPVLGAEVLEFLTFPADRPARLIDGTLGGGGHSAMLLRRYPQLALLGIDRDEAALAKAAETLAFASGRTRFVRGNYSELAGIAAENGWKKVDGILLDIGVSSPQIDRPERGFSWRAEGPLDHADGPPLGTHGQPPAEYGGGARTRADFPRIRRSRQIAEARGGGSQGPAGETVRGDIGPRRPVRRGARPEPSGAAPGAHARFPGAADRGERRTRRT